MDAFVKRLPQTESCNPFTSETAATPDIETARPIKRARVEIIADSEADSEEEDSSTWLDTDIKAISSVKREASGDDEEEVITSQYRATEIENALPLTQEDEDAAIEEYNAAISSQQNVSSPQGTSEKTRPLWLKGRSSIYVDAFNLALDTVLEDEAHLFNEPEMEVFRQWRDLDYQSQYL